jgi:formamidopyrimidine-DNA glycosylase
MPESPEVTLMAEKVNKQFKNCLLENIQFKTGKMKKPNQLFYLKKNLPLTIKKIYNKGKFITIELEKEWNIGITLGMTGHLVTHNTSQKSFKTSEGYVYNPKHNHVTFKTICTHPHSFFLNDPRLFGKIYIYNPSDKKNTLQKKIHSLGVDVLKELPKMKQKKFETLLEKHKKKVLADLLLDQTIISGVGNYIRAEVMYQAGIAPLRLVGSLQPFELKKLKKELEKVTKNSYLCQRSKGIHRITFRIFRQPHAKKIKRQNRTIWWDPTKQS